MTIIQRWVLVKDRIQSGVVRAGACVREARKIVKERCGQDVQEDIHWVQPQTYLDKIWIRWGGRTMFFTEGGHWADGIGNGTWPVREQHLSMSIRDAEALANALDAVTTGEVISCWEQKE